MSHWSPERTETFLNAAGVLRGLLYGLTPQNVEKRRVAARTVLRFCPDLAAVVAAITGAFTRMRVQS